jgi:hypothetical protein
VLSAVDLKVLALNYMLEKEQNGTKHLRSEPAEENTKSIPGVERVVGRNVKDTMCMHFDSEKGCRRGDLCPYRHPLDVTEAELIIEEVLDRYVRQSEWK